MTITLSDLAPVIIAGVMAVVGLATVWHAVRQAHGPDRRRRKQEHQAGE